MSYPDTSTTYGLAQVIQGEASNNADQFGVASTIWNRLQAGGWGSSLGSVVNQANFNGGTSATVPSANALSLANALTNGNISDYGNTGNVTYYSASNNSTNPNAANYVNPSMQGVANAGNTLSPGGNSFSTGTARGPSLSGTVLPSYGGSSANGLTDDDLVDDNYDYYSNASPAAQNAYLASTDTSNPSIPDSSWSLFDEGGDSSAASNATNTGYNALTGAGGVNASTGLFSGTNDTSDLSGLTGSSVTMGATSPTSAASLAGGGGAPITITDLPGLDTSVTSAGKAVQTGAGTIGSDVTGAASGITGTAASAVNALQTYASSAVVVTAIVVLGLIFVAFGLSMFKHNIVQAA